LREIFFTQRTQRENRKERKAFSLYTLREFCVLCGFVFFFSTISYSQSDKFGGIGVSVDIDSSVMQPYIVDILSGKPGAMAGLRSGDHIISINHWNTKGKSQEQVANKLRGRIGSKVDLDIDRGGKQMDFLMKRERIVVNEKAGNLCEGLDTVIKSCKKWFNEVRKIDISVKDLDGGAYGFSNNIILPNFDNCLVLKDWKNKVYFQADYFVGLDSLQAMSCFKRIVTDVRDCMPYTISGSFTESTGANITSFSTTFTIDQVKNPKYEWVKGSSIIIKCEHKLGSAYEVKLIYENSNL